MRRKWTEEEKKKRKEMIKANPEMKRGGKKIWIDLGDIRIVKSDQWNWTVEEDHPEERDLELGRILW